MAQLTTDVPVASRLATGQWIRDRVTRLRAGTTSARSRILGWFVILMAMAIAASLIIERQVLLHRLSHRVDTDMSLAVAALNNQSTSLPADTSTRLACSLPVCRLFDAYLHTHLPFQDGEFLTLVDGRPFEASYGGRTRLEDVTSLVRTAAAARQPTWGEAVSPAGPVRFLAVPVRQPGSPMGTFVVADFTSPAQQEVDSDVAVAAAVSLTMLVVMAVIAWLVAGRVLAPVRLMTNAARSITDTDLSQRIPIKGDDEVAQLADTFNTMLDRLSAAFASQREFVTDAGHELRTPITIVRGHLELLGDDPTERAETLALVRDELDRMSRMVDDLLLLAKAERPGFLRQEPVAVHELVDELLAKVTTLAPRHWSTKVSAPVQTLADRQRLTQAVMNLVANSVAHTGPDDSITLGLDSGRDEYVLWVSDTGTGIAYEDQTRIFERFARGRNERRRSQGAGLGLSIVRAIAEAHGGRVELESTPGRGATFRLVLPVDRTVRERR